MDVREIEVFIATRFELWVEAQAATDADNITFFNAILYVLGELLSEAANRVVIFFNYALLDWIGGIQGRGRETELGDGIFEHISCLHVMDYPNQCHRIDGFGCTFVFITTTAAIAR